MERSELVAKLQVLRPDLTERQIGFMIGDCPQHGAFKFHQRLPNGASAGTDCPECRMVEIKSRLIERAKIPTRFTNSTFDNWNTHGTHQKAAHAAVASWVSLTAGGGSNASMALIGKPGTGKTHLGCAAIRWAIETWGCRARYSTTRDVIRAIRDTWRRNSEQSEEEVLCSLIAPDVLVLDEVGVQTGTDNERVILFDVLDGRYRENRATLLISNEDMNGLREYLGERLIDRLRDNGGKIITFDWESHRKAA